MKQIKLLFTLTIFCAITAGNYNYNTYNYNTLQSLINEIKKPNPELNTIKSCTFLLLILMVKVIWAVQH